MTDDRHLTIKEFYDSYMKGTNKISLEAFKLKLAEMDLLIAEQESVIMKRESSLLKYKDETISIQNQLIEAQRLYIAELKQEIAQLKSVNKTSTQPTIIIERQSVETTKPKSKQPKWHG